MVLARWWTLSSRDFMPLKKTAQMDVWDTVWMWSGELSPGAWCGGAILFFLEDCTELLSKEKNGPHTSMAVHTVTPALSVRGGGRRVTNSRPVCPKLNRKRGVWILRKNPFLNIKNYLKCSKVLIKTIVITYTSSRCNRFWSSTLYFRLQETKYSSSKGRFTLLSSLPLLPLPVMRASKPS